MKKRYQVFVSSTFRDLVEERRQVQQALLEIECFPAGMELFPASDENQWTLIKRVIDDSDYYIVVIGGRYGSLDADGLGFTEKEYDYAVEKGIPVLGFVHSEPDSIPLGKSEVDAQLRAKLDAFREKVKRRMCRMWKTPEELGGAVSRSVIQAITRQEGEGWVRGRFGAASDEVVRLRTQLQQLEAKQRAIRTEPPPEAAVFASGSDRISLRFVQKGAGTVKKTPSWDEVIAILAPKMFDPIPEWEMAEILARAAAADRTEGNRDLHLVDEDFQTVKVQLLALGVIRKHDEKVNGHTAWTLTPYGETCALRLKAIRRVPSQDPAPSISK